MYRGQRGRATFRVIDAKASEATTQRNRGRRAGRAADGNRARNWARMISDRFRCQQSCVLVKRGGARIKVEVEIQGETQQAAEQL